MKTKFLMPTGDLVERDFPQFKTPFNHDTNFESDRTALYCKDESLTKQEFAHETDINVILERFTRTGEPPPMPVPEDFIDTTHRATFLQISQELADANALFYKLPARIRNACANNVGLWADQVVQATARGDGDRLNELGLALTEKQAARLPPQPEPQPGVKETPDPKAGQKTGQKASNEATS